MPTSGTVVYNNTGDEIIKAAFRKLGLVAQGEEPTAEMVQNARGDLNRLIKAWQAQGYHLWTISEAILFLQPNQQKYSLGSGGDNSTLTSGLVSTSLSVAASSSDTTVTLTSVVDVTNGKNIGIILDSGVTLWTTVVGSPVGSVVTIATPLPSVAAAGQTVYAYTTKVTRPSRLVQGRVQVDTTNEIEMTILSDTDYFMLSNKSAAGVPTQYYYNPTLDNGELYIWPTAQTSNYAIKFTFESYIQDINTITDNPQFPSEWLKPLVWNLAEEIMMDYGVDDSTALKVSAKAAAALDEALAYDQENASVIFQPFPDYSYRNFYSR